MGCSFADWAVGRRRLVDKDCGRGAGQVGRIYAFAVGQSTVAEGHEMLRRRHVSMMKDITNVSDDNWTRASPKACSAQRQQSTGKASRLVFISPGS